MTSFIKKLAFFLFASASSLYAQNNTVLTVEKIMRDPKVWIGTSPSNISWSTNSQTIYFDWNPDKAISDSVYAYNISEKRNYRVSLTERRTMIPTGFSYNSDFSQITYARDGDIFVLNRATSQKKQLTNTVERENSPYFSADGKLVFFDKGNNIFCIDLSSGLHTQLTDFKPGNKKAEPKVNPEEQFLKRDQLATFEILRERKEKKDAGKKNAELEKITRPKEIYTGERQVNGQKASPDGRFITYRLGQSGVGAKPTAVPTYVTESGFTENIPGRTKVGAPASSYEFWIYDTKKDSAQKLILKNIPGIRDKPDYLADYPGKDTLWGKKDREVVVLGPFWSTTGKNAIVVVRSMDSKDRWIMRLDAENMSLALLDRQRDEAWIGGPGVGSYPESSGDVGWIDDETFYFQSEATGYSHLYSINATTGTKKQLTQGNFEVQKVVLSKDRKHFYLISNEVHPGEQHLYSLDVTGGGRTKLTNKTGAHEFTLSPDEKQFAIRFSDSTHPWELFVMDNQLGSPLTQITRSVTDEFKSYAWRDPKVVTVPASDGARIYARLYEPKKSNGKAVIFVHGAGYLQNAHKWWSQYFREYMFHNLLTDKGYTILDMDYRASSGYGRDWRTGIYRFMGGKDLSDHTDGAKWLVKNHKIDPEKIGIYGGSYGGFITLMALFTTPDIFKAGAALRPVTDWAAYNQSYTANILNEPQHDSLSYRRSSPIYHAAGLKNHLLICHGMADVNVHYQDVVRLSQRLIELGKNNWELASYPMEDHGFVEPSSWTDEYKRILKLFEEKLK
jgi:dipeptidyl aminopeptidase/acylaminoacyl peptidase